MKFKLNRLFLFFDRTYLLSFFILHGLMFILPLVLIMINYQAAIWNIGFLCAINIFIYLAIKHTYPKSFDIAENTINIIVYNNLGQRGGRSKAFITLTDLHDISFSQNSIEKLFGVGRISLKAIPSAEIISGNPTNEKFPLSNTYTFYGVTNFNKAKDEITKISK